MLMVAYSPLFPTSSFLFYSNYSILCLWFSLFHIVVDIRRKVILLNSTYDQKLLQIISQCQGTCERRNVFIPAGYRWTGAGSVSSAFVFVEICM